MGSRQVSSPGITKDHCNSILAWADHGTLPQGLKSTLILSQGAGGAWPNSETLNRRKSGGRKLVEEEGGGRRTKKRTGKQTLCLPLGFSITAGRLKTVSSLSTQLSSAFRIRKYIKHEPPPSAETQAHRPKHKHSRQAKTPGTQTWLRALMNWEVDDEKSGSSILHRPQTP